ncbi:MAG: N-acetylmuramoyl-L-alanine amidase [Candidatus Gracilibacteria bacterium]|nr:N-acetylmuramoyl-L-alanine amidase [Candidatus Gracilibacteria bacterium]
MKKIITFLFICFLLITNNVFAGEELKIITRQEWGANEEYRYMDSEQWQAIIKRRNETPVSTQTEAQKEAARKKTEQTKSANTLLTKYFYDLLHLKSSVSYEDGHKLAWPISKTDKIESLVVHHTHSEYTDSYDAVRSIYRYHALSNEWGDIGYNFLIGYDGEIFEGRAGGENTVGAHAQWNNRSTIGIALIGDYDNKPISEKQYESLKNLVSYLVDKYDINLAKKSPFFKWCIAGDNCKLPLEIDFKYPIVGHRDAGHTDCPGEELYAQLDKLRLDLLKEKFGFNVALLNKKLDKLNDLMILEFLVKLESLLDGSLTNKQKNYIEKVKDVILAYEKNKYLENDFLYSINYDDTHKIKVKLSYPDENYIDIKTKGQLKPTLIEKDNEYIISFEKTNIAEKTYNLPFELRGNDIYLDNKKLTRLNDGIFVRLTLPENYYFTIDSWDRQPAWDTTGELNDNKFKGDIVLYQKDSKLVVVNDLYLTDYLKGLGEVSNSENNEKIETIIILARTYARWYTQIARKFPGEWYDASDDPNVFQKYLGYGLEQRSPNINAIIEKTKDIVVTYNDEIIKPWYFSKSDGKTLSFYEYCNQNTQDINYCSIEAKKYPFLKSAVDLGGEGQEKAGHGVGVPGTGVKYFAERGWVSQMIIKYFLKGVDIKKI